VRPAPAAIIQNTWRISPACWRRTAGYLIGRHLTYADLSLFQLIEKLRYAFAKVLRRLEGRNPGLAALHDPDRQAPSYSPLPEIRAAYAL